MFNEQQLKKIILDNKLMSEADLAKEEKEAKENDKNLEVHLAEKHLLEEKDLYEKAAKFFSVPFINLKDATIKKEALFLVPEPIAIAHSIIAFDLQGKELSLAVLDPEDLETFEKKDRL